MSNPNVFNPIYSNKGIYGSLESRQARLVHQVELYNDIEDLHNKDAFSRYMEIRNRIFGQLPSSDMRVSNNLTIGYVDFAILENAQADLFETIDYLAGKVRSEIITPYDFAAATWILGFLSHIPVDGNGQTYKILITTYLTEFGVNQFFPLKPTGELSEEQRRFEQSMDNQFSHVHSNLRYRLCGGSSSIYTLEDLSEAFLEIINTEHRDKLDAVFKSKDDLSIAFKAFKKEIERLSFEIEKYLRSDFGTPEYYKTQLEKSRSLE